MLEAVRQYAGGNYSEEGTRESVPVNMLSLYVSVVGRNMIAKNPRVQYSTFNKQGKPTVAAMETWANDQIKAMYFADTMKRTVVNAMFSLGINKVSLMTPAENAMRGYKGLAGEPRVTNILLDDFVFDIHAKDFRESGYMGHKIRVPVEAIKSDKRYSKYRKEINATPDLHFNEQGDEKLTMIGRGYYAINDEEYDDFTDIWEVYVPSRRMIYTLIGDDVNGSLSGTDRVLLEQPWIGPDCGPYHILGYGIVPGSAMPKAPIQDLLDLHKSINNIYRKLIRQAERMKEILLVSGTASEAGQRILEASDGEMIECQNPDGVKSVGFGGPNQMLQAFVMELKNMFSWLAGNLDIMGGLSPQSKTATQDTMLNANSARGIADMQDSTVTHVSAVLEALGWYWWHDPKLEMKSHFTVPGVPEISRQIPITSQQRQRLAWEEVRVTTDPYSMQHQTPQMKMQNLMSLMQQIIIPMMPILQQQGIQVDMNKLLAKAGEYQDAPDFSEIVTYSEAVQQEQTPQGDAMPPAGGTKTYERVSRPGMTDKGNDQVKQQILMGGNPQDAQRQKLNQPQFSV